MRRRQTAAVVIVVGHRSTLQSRVTVAVDCGGFPPCLDRFQAGGLGYMTKMTELGQRETYMKISWVSDLSQHSCAFTHGIDLRQRHKSLMGTFYADDFDVNRIYFTWAN